MKKIASFTVNHDTLTEGMYISRIDGDVITYDIRMKKPNGGDYLANGAMHTFEHLFATFARNTEFADKVIYVGPMGCRTGCYFLTRGMDGQDVIKLTRKAFQFIADYEGEIPGVSAVECGNYRDHDLAQAKIDAADMVEVLTDYTNLEYPTK